MDLSKARKKLDSVLDEKVRVEYYAELRKGFALNNKIAQEEYDVKLRSFLHTDEQIKYHYEFLSALFSKAFFPNLNANKYSGCGSTFQPLEYSEHVKPSQSIPSLLHYTYGSAASEIFLPFSNYIQCKINIIAWQCGLEESTNNEVTKLVGLACQTFVKNIITAMISKVKGFKIREGKFQYGFNMPIPNPLLRNSENCEENRSMMMDDEFLPKYRKSLEQIESERAFAYAASKNIKRSSMLDKKLLYETIRGNPQLLGQHGLQSVQVLKLSLIQDSDESLSSEDSDN